MHTVRLVKNACRGGILLIFVFLTCRMLGCAASDSSGTVIVGEATTSASPSLGGESSVRTADGSPPITTEENGSVEKKGNAEEKTGASGKATNSDSAEDSGAEDVGDRRKTTDKSSTAVRQRVRKRTGGIYDLTFDDLEFDIEPDEDFQRDMLTPDIEELDGKPAIIRGFIFDGSVYTQKGIKQFVLIRDNQECCFGPGAKIFHNIMVEMKPGRSANFTIRPVQVEGQFKIQPWVNPGDGKTYSVFHIDADKVK